MTEQRISDYGWWRAALAGKNPPIFIDRIECGRFKLKHPGGSGVMPAAIWVDAKTQKLTLRIGTMEDDLVMDSDAEILPYWETLAKSPISDEEYKAGLAGKWITKGPSNNPPADNTPEAIGEQIDAAIAEAQAQKTAPADERGAEIAAGRRNRLLELAGVADKLREAEKAPILAKGKEIDAKWTPCRNRAKDEADRLRKLLSAYETEKDRKQAAWREEERKRAIEKGHTVEEAETLVGEPEEPKLKAAYGRASQVRTKIVVKSVADWDAIYRRYSEVPEVVEILTKLILRDIGRGEEVPGVITEQVKDVR